MAIMAWFDLKLVQYNILNAFVNINIDKEVYMYMCYEPTKHGTTRAYRMQATEARQVSTGRTGVPRSCAEYWVDWAMGQ
jgi:hypothetical protein